MLDVSVSNNPEEKLRSRVFIQIHPSESDWYEVIHEDSLDLFFSYLINNVLQNDSIQNMRAKTRTKNFKINGKK